MLELLEQAVAAYEAGEQSVLCTVVRLDGSGYGRPGARLLLTESGLRLGFISGGCLEKDLCRRVWGATSAGPKLLAFDTRGDSVDVPRYNTGCEGVVYVFCQRINAYEAGLIRIIQDAYTSGQEIRLLTVYRSDSDYAQAGDAILIKSNEPEQDGEFINILGNSSWTAFVKGEESNLIQKLRSASRNGSFAFQDSNGDAIEVSIEIISPPRRLIVFGAGDDVVPVVAACVTFGWHVTVVGHRAELTEQRRFPGAKVVCGEINKTASDLLIADSRLSKQTDVVVMTHDFDRDVELMEVLLDSSVRTIGLLGPKRRLAHLVKRLYERGRILSEYDICRIRSPLGLDIGAISPAEIATSIVAELIALSRQRAGGFLHERQKPIHAPSEHLSIHMERGVAAISDREVVSLCPSN